MTTRNLNQTWRDVVFSQYASDYENNVAFPIRYTIHTPQWNRDIRIEIPSRVDVRTFRRSIADFFVSKHRADPVYQDEYISVRPRISPFDRQDQDNDDRQDDPELQDVPVHVGSARDSG